MDSFDKKVADLYNKNQTPDQLPEGFVWDEMSKGIYEKMESPNRKRKPLFWWLTFGGFILLVSVPGIFFIQKSNNIAPNQTTETSLPTIKEKSTFSSDKPIAEATQIGKEPSATATLQNTHPYISNNKISNKSIVLNNKKTKTLYQESKPIHVIELRDIMDLTTIESESIISTSSPETSVSGAEDFPESVNTKKSENTFATSVPASTTKTVVPSTLPLRWVTMSSDKIIAPNILLPKEKPTDTPSKIAIKFTPKVYGGTLLTTGKYTENQERNTYSRWSPGYYTGIDFTILAYKKWTLNLGYEHKFATQVLELNNIVDTVVITVENALTSITTNSLNGTTSENRETITTNGTRTRNYLHYNTFRSHALRLTLNRTFPLTPKWHLTTGFGGTYNFLNQARGTTLDLDGNKLEYSPDMPIYLKRNFAIDAGLSLEYKIGRIKLSGNLWLEKSLSFGLEPETSIQPTFYKIGVGAAFTL